MIEIKQSDYKFQSIWYFKDCRTHVKLLIASLPDYIESENSFYYENNGESKPFIYTSGLTEGSFSLTPLLQTKEIANQKSVVVYVDGYVELVKNSERKTMQSD